MVVGLKSFGNKIIKKLQLLEKKNCVSKFRYEYKIVFQRLDMKVKLNKGAFYGLTNGLCPFSWEVLEFVWHPHQSMDHH